ncbi:hypothetical protein [Parapedobacter indicus]|uniref:Apea-like HEPN domain-containing protein n=1 Tax=Parapedobacter indicus TaxID=1477437 RepID=A0A1I3JCH6_9SPHI|nr:hypothetical protein [Parapedobacter indicus]PPL02467.1 hypothetical protein CLV26_104397 [Parapedobacter indicus]SFI57972.1 hypothetical protein SAMN05444682_104396 [Parapedobacter indicus]
MERSTKQYLKDFRDDIRNDVNFDLLMEFFVVFSRFEFTLKIAGYLQDNVKNEARPDWLKYGLKKKETFDDYIDSLETGNELKMAIEYILINPPKKQFVGDGNMLIFALVPDENPSNTQKLCTYITRIRNNLFHGAKFLKSYGDSSRDWKLIHCALLVLSCWIDDDQNFRSWFFEG